VILGPNHCHSGAISSSLTAIATATAWR